MLSIQPRPWADAGAAAVRSPGSDHRADPRGDEGRAADLPRAVEQYLRRIDAYDKNGPAINAIVMINPEALKQADELDRASRRAAWPVRCTASR